MLFIDLDYALPLFFLPMIGIGTKLAVPATYLSYIARHFLLIFSAFVVH